MRGLYPPQFPDSNGGIKVRGVTNPAPVIFPNGTVLALYKVNKTIWAMRAPDYRVSRRRARAASGSGRLGWAQALGALQLRIIRA